MGKKEAEFNSRLLAGQCLYRQASFECTIRDYVCVCGDLAELHAAIRKNMPADLNIGLLVDIDEGAILLTSERWKAVMSLEGEDGGRWHYTLWFEVPEVKGFHAVSQYEEASFEINITLTAIEKALLVLDARTLLKTRYGTSEERYVTVGRLKEKTKKGVIETGGVIAWALDRAMTAGFNAAEK